MEADAAPSLAGKPFGAATAVAESGAAAGGVAGAPDPPGGPARAGRAGDQSTALGATEAGGGKSEYTIRPFESRHLYCAWATGEAASASNRIGSRCLRDMARAL